MPKRTIVRLLAAAVVSLAPLVSVVPVGAAAPAVALSPTALNFGMVLWDQASSVQNIVVTNTGTAPLNIQTVDISGQPFVPEDFTLTGSTNPCPPSFVSLAPGAQCLIAVVFRPQTGGPRSATLSIFDNAADSPQSIAMSGAGTGAVIMFTPRFLDFGTVDKGTTSAPMTFTTVNAGDSPVTISRVALDTLSTDFAIPSDGCTGITLGPGGRCSISATVTPTTIGETDGQLVDVFDNAGTGEQRYDGSLVGLEATGGGPEVAVVGGVPRPNQGVGTSSTIPLQLFDAGTEAVQIATISLDTLTSGFTITHDGCSGTTLPVNSNLLPPATCELDLAFAPPATGTFVANLLIHDNEFGGVHTQPISGSGFAPVAALSTSALDFGFQPVGVPSASQVVTLTNPSPQALSISSLSLSGANPGSFSLSNNSCGGTIAPGGSCSVAVAMTPAFPYLFTATLSFSDNAGGSPAVPQVVSLRGEGESPTFSISTSLINIGNQHAGTASAPQSVTVTNTSSGPLSFGFLPGAGLSGSGCSTPVAAGGSCVVTVVTTPPAVGQSSALLKIFDASFNQQVVEFDWNGVSGSALVESSNLLAIQRVGTTETRQVTVRNGGSDLLKIGQVSLTGNGPVSIAGDGCTNQSIGIDSACLITVAISPVIAGSWSAVVNVPTDSVLGSNPATLSIQGVASPAPQPVFSPASVAFPTQPVGGTEIDQIVWVDNGLTPSLGALPMTFSSIGISGPGASAFRVVWDGCSGLTIDGAFSCPVEVGFAPTTGGTFDASLDFTDDGTGSPQTVALSGTAVAGAIPSPQQVDFGSVAVNTKSPGATVILTNESANTVTISRATLGGANKGDFTIVSENCQNQALAPGASCQLTVVFRPQALGDRTATLTFTDTATNSPQVVQLKGSGVSK